jgi:hypothetical protein
LSSFLAGYTSTIGPAPLSYFREGEAYARMVRDICGETAHHSRLKNILPYPKRRESASVSVRFDETLVDIVCRAADISLTRGKGKIDVDDFMTALALSNEIVEQLAKDRGISLRT